MIDKKKMGRIESVWMDRDCENMKYRAICFGLGERIFKGEYETKLKAIRKVKEILTMMEELEGDDGLINPTKIKNGGTIFTTYGAWEKDLKSK